MKRLIFLALLAPLATNCPAASAVPRKPPCNAKSHSRFWPDEANSNGDAARRLSQEGVLQMCTLVVWQYRWEPLSVNVHDLANKKGATNVDCPKIVDEKAATR